ncbi:MAG: TonB-dependent receptor, partial [Aureibaculum sp.]|nr:TonB-dependent receptor [Aureibaculum sp.]
MSVNKLILLVFLVFSNTIIIGQTDTINLKEIMVSTNRISLPSFKSSRTISIITQEEINRATASNVADLLQQVAGID